MLFFLYLCYASVLKFLQLAPWKIAAEIYFSFLSSTNPCLFLTDNEEMQKLCYFIKDFAVLTQLTSRLSSSFLDQGTENFL